MAHASSNPENPTEQRLNIGPNAIWATLCLALLLSGYFYGLHSGSDMTGMGSRHGVSNLPSQADNTLPMAPATGQPAGAAPAPGDLLARAQLENELLYTDLQSFVCDEQIQRYRGHLNGQDPHHIDAIDARLSFENGVESYTDILDNNHPRPALSSIPGAWSEGEFGTLLRQTRALLSTQPISVEPATDSNGGAAAVYTFYVSGNDSPWELNVASQLYRVPFRTKVTVSKSSGQILKIDRASTAMPPGSGISEIQWGVSLAPVDLDGKTFLLPKTGEYSVLYQNSNRREWNQISFSNYHRYTSRSIIHF